MAKKKPTSAFEPTKGDDIYDHDHDGKEAREGDAEDDELMAYPATSKMTGLKMGTLYSMVKKHEIPHVRLGRRLVRFRRSEILRWLKDASVPVGKVVA